MFKLSSVGHARSMINVSRRRVWLLLFSVLCFIAIAELILRRHGEVRLQKTSFNAKQHAEPKKYSKTLVVGYRERRD
jgi:hypothetical protein